MSARHDIDELRGFTLIEVLAVVFLMGVVLTFTMGFFINLTNSSEYATIATRDGRRAVSILDRVARDLEGTFHVSQDPESTSIEPHPWLFLADVEFSSEGSDSLRFATTSVRPRGDQKQNSDIATVAYALRRGPHGGFELLRQVVPGRPSEALREFPRGDEEGTTIVGEDLEDFSLRFYADDGAESSTWDSSVRASDELSETPVAARIALTLALLDEAGEVIDPFDDPGALDAPSRRWARSVVLPIRALPNEVLTEGLGFIDDGQDETGDQDCTLTVGQCLAQVTAERAAQLCSDKEMSAIQASSNICLQNSEGSKLRQDVFCLREACGL